MHYCGWLNFLYFTLRSTQIINNNKHNNSRVNQTMLFSIHVLSHNAGDASWLPLAPLFFIIPVSMSLSKVPTLLYSVFGVH